LVDTFDLRNIETSVYLTHRMYQSQLSIRFYTLRHGIAYTTTFQHVTLASNNCFANTCEVVQEQT
jgi:hypothetical protein